MNRLEDTTNIATMERHRAISQNELLVSEMETLRSEMSVNNRLMVRDRSSDSELARTKMDMEILKNEYEAVIEEEAKVRQRFTRLECMTHEGWVDHHGQMNAAQINASKQEYEIWIAELRSKVAERDRELADHNRAMAVLHHDFSMQCS